MTGLLPLLLENARRDGRPHSPFPRNRKDVLERIVLPSILSKERLTWFVIRTSILAFFLLLLPGGGLFAQQVTPLSEIHDSSASFAQEVLTVEGYVTQRAQSAGPDSVLYYLKGTNGTLLAVRSAADAPEVGNRYAITGPLIVGSDQSPYLRERSRTQIAPPGTQTEAPSRRALLYGFGGAIVFVIVSLIAVLVYGRWTSDSDGPTGQTGDRTAEEALGEPPESDHVVENDTLKMRVPPEEGWEVLPGRLLVKSGLEDVSEIPFYSVDGQRTSPLTFGRTDDASLAHVQLKAPSVSNWQAKIVYDADDDRCTLINYALESRKPTLVNGRPLEKRESVELRDGDQLVMGDVEFEYAVD
jgi:hypothetical protein